MGNIHKIGIDKKPHKVCRTFIIEKVTILAYFYDEIISTTTKVFSIILHGFFGAAEFKPFHETLSRLAKEKRVTYALRHVTPLESRERVRLSGYGVELAVKSTEYKAQVQ